MLRDSSSPLERLKMIGDRQKGGGGTETLKIPKEFLKRGNLAKQVTAGIDIPYPSAICNPESANRKFTKH